MTVANGWSGHGGYCLNCFSVCFTGSLEESISADFSGRVHYCL